MDNKIITAIIDRPLGSIHPKHSDMTYPINYGYIKGLIAPDGDEQDVYVLGVLVPLEIFTGKLIAIVHRNDDVETKWVACPQDMLFTKEEIEKEIFFTEQYFDSFIEML